MPRTTIYGGGVQEVELQNASFRSGGMYGKPWTVFLGTIFPIPLLGLIALSVPLPAKHRRSVRIAILNFLDKASLGCVKLSQLWVVGRLFM